MKLSKVKISSNISICHANSVCLSVRHTRVLYHKKAVLSQRWPRNAPYAWVPWKFSGHPDYAHGYYSQHFPWVFVPIDPMNVPTILKVRSFTRSCDNRGTQKIWAVPGYANAPFSPKLLMGFYSINVQAKFEVRSFTCSWDKRG